MLSLFVRHFSIASQEYRIIHRVELAKLRANEDKLHFSAFFFFFYLHRYNFDGKNRANNTPRVCVFFFFLFKSTFCLSKACEISGPAGMCAISHLGAIPARGLPSHKASVGSPGKKKSEEDCITENGLC